MGYHSIQLGRIGKAVPREYAGYIKTMTPSTSRKLWNPFISVVIIPFPGELPISENAAG